MKEILFRGKRDNGEWVEGNLFIPDLPNTPTQICIGTNVIRITYDIIPETVGQYTGLTDKNGKKIFEGDIVDCWSEGVNAQGEVQQRRDGLWIIYPAWQKHIMWGLCPDAYSHTTVEVIGNIHDNPELIKT
jgi:uncharacterized phage protein (TIGR01671 family)